MGLCVKKTIAQDPTVGCENCPEDTTCIKDMCYTVIAAPPGMDSKCNEAFCKVEKGGQCINDQCVVLQNGIALAPSGAFVPPGSNPPPPDAAPSSGIMVRSSMYVMSVILVVYTGM